MNRDEAATDRLLSEQPKIDKSVAILIGLLRAAVADGRHGTTGLRVSIQDGRIHTFYETSEFTTK